MSLKNYFEKRDFTRTPEPQKGEKITGDTLHFVVQRHQASKLHYDFRLEMDGVLKSWVIPKGPSMNPKDKRLAVMVEDHPLEYRTFEGEIPEGNYGAGIVTIWDEGTYQVAPDNEEPSDEKTLLSQLKKGSLTFILKGKRLKGIFSLVKLQKGDPDSWLLIKKKDEEATEKAYNSEDFVKKAAIKTTRTRKTQKKPSAGKPDPSPKVLQWEQKRQQKKQKETGMKNQKTGIAKEWK
ncbi:3'-phosphoesterase [Rhodocytophaga rosea]|uniref:3'-phosphoesterase n=1 Tax=Rhodocytophaga rosea TaxID=2704465 RepID=A0A6C0GFB5_9BACT|nr:DNA polymerase ligase N-terminal domain-containing protein [Rhodocytophaga rosea]QHT66648.1 3'-phosphoesterase [Rhodocytophaga rosea]